MGKGGFAEWAHFQGIAAGAALLCGGPICFFYPMWYLGPYGLAVGLLITALEWPLGSMKTALGAIYSNYSIRGVLYILLSVVCYLQAALFNGGNFLTFCGITYLVAHLQGERYKPPRGKAAPAPRAQGDKR